MSRLPIVLIATIAFGPPQVRLKADSTTAAVIAPGFGRSSVVESGFSRTSVVGPGFSRAHLQPSATLAEARRLFEALDYERAVPALDLAIAELEPRLAAEPPARALLASAYEMRARARFGLGDAAGTSGDFKRLLTIAPAHKLAGQVSPRVVSIFEEARKTTVGLIVLKLEPNEADFQLDGARLTPGSEPLPLTAGSHTISGARPGYRTASQTFTLEAGAAQDVALTLERVSATVSLVTRPPGVTVTVDGVARGATLPGGAQVIDPAPNRVPGAAPETLSQPMLIADLAPGAHLLGLSRDCYVKVERRFVVEQLSDYRLDPVELKPAVASISVAADAEGATVSLDGQARGPAPLRLQNICEGTHTIEARTPYGRFVQRVEARAGDAVSVSASLKPAFAIVDISGVPAALGSLPDARLLLERAMAGVRTLTVFAPATEQLAAALKEHSLPQGWTGTGRDGRRLGDAARVTAQARLEIASRLARQVGAQGLAALTFDQDDPASGNASLSLLAEGSAEPDVIAISFGRPDSAGRIAARLNPDVPLYEPSIGVSAIDAADVAGAVVVRVDSTAAAAPGGLAPGDIIVRAGTQAIQNASDLAAVVARAKPTDTLALEARGAANATKQVGLRVAAAPRAISLADQTLVPNALIPVLRERASHGGPDEALARLNLAIALIRVESWALARGELERVSLPTGPGISAGTVKYLLGLCYEALGQTAEAKTAWTEAARDTEATLGEDGPSVKEAAEARLGRVKQP